MVKCCNDVSVHLDSFTLVRNYVHCFSKTTHFSKKEEEKKNVYTFKNQEERQEISKLKEMKT